MTPQEAPEHRPTLFMDDECRMTRIEGVPAEAREWLADLFIVLRRGMTEEDHGPLAVQAELDRFIELMFRESEAYRLALKLYAGRYEVIACRDVADILREAIEKHMPDSPAVSEESDAGEDDAPEE
jgi:hypothetical protein